MKVERTRTDPTPSSIERGTLSRRRILVEWLDQAGIDVREDGNREIGKRDPPEVQPIEVIPRGEYRIWIRYSDGVSGEVDLSHLAGRGVFKAWNERAVFESVQIASGGAIAWGDDIDLCPDAIYMQLTGKCVEELMSGARTVFENA